MIKRELSIFLIVGSLTVLVDFVIYRGFYSLGFVGVDLAKGIGFIAGTLFAFFANRIWTFGHKNHVSGSIWRFLFLYSATLSANVLINALALEAFSKVVGVVQLAFLLATGVSATLNFIGMKWFVFKTKPMLDQV